MPIGKNAVKRVENNGYSKVETSAPDMENSNVIANLDEQVMEKLIAPVEEKAKKRTTKKAVKKAAPVAEEKPAKRKYTKRAVKSVKEVKEGFSRVELGNEMPYYLL